MIEADTQPSTLDVSECPAASPPPRGEQRMILSNVSWKTYEHLLADFENSSSPRFAYNRGILEIMSPFAEHQRRNRTLALLVEEVADVWELDLEDLGSTTYKREDQERGFEPDSSFYIQHAAQIRDREKIDLAADPPPDLVIEIDLTSSSMDKLPMYAQLGVPEVWRDQKGGLTIYTLKGSAYTAQEESRVLPPLTSELITSMINQCKSLKRGEWRKRVRDWARTVAEERSGGQSDA
jgi:Uma2 family endonuclease